MFRSYMAVNVLTIINIFRRGFKSLMHLALYLRLLQLSISN